MSYISLGRLTTTVILTVTGLLTASALAVTGAFQLASQTEGQVLWTNSNGVVTSTSNFRYTSSTKEISVENAVFEKVTSTEFCISNDCKTAWSSSTSSWYGPIEFSNTTGTNATTTNLFSTNADFTYLHVSGTGYGSFGGYPATSLFLTADGDGWSQVFGDQNAYNGRGAYYGYYVNDIGEWGLMETSSTGHLLFHYPPQVTISGGRAGSLATSYNFLPGTNDAISLGNNSYKWAGLYTTNVTSTNATTTNLYSSGVASTTRLLYASATGTTLNLTGNFKAGSSTVTTLNFTNATGTNITATTGIFTNLCLTGDDCITTWPSGTGSGEIPQLTQVLNTGRSATTTPTFDMGFTATSGTITNATATNFDVTTRLGWLDATGTSLFSTSGGFTSLYTGAFTANGTGATSTNLYISGNSIVTSLQWTNATGTTLALTGNFSAGSSTVTTLNFTNATGTAIYASSYTGSTITVTSATMTNLGVTSLLVGGKLPCLADGTNCPFASIAETSTGTETAKAITPDSLAGSNYGKRFIELQMATDTKAYLATSAATSCQMIPPELNGWYLVDAWATNNTVGAGGTSTQIQIVRATSTDAVVWTYSDMLSRPIHIDPPEIGSWSAMATTTPAINASNKTVTAYEMVCAEIKALTNTPPKGTVTAITLQAP